MYKQAELFNMRIIIIFFFLYLATFTNNKRCRVAIAGKMNMHTYGKNMAFD